MITVTYPTIVLKHGRFFTSLGEGCLLPYIPVIPFLKEEMRLFGVSGYPELMDVYDELRGFHPDPAKPFNLRRALRNEMLQLVLLHEDSHWDRERKLLVTHTYWLREIHKRIPFPGVFETSSSGSTRQNCYLFFRDDKLAWQVERYGGALEHPCWNRKPGKTSILFNYYPEAEEWERSLAIQKSVGGGIYDKYFA